jgi:hypothetical protein
VGDRVLDLLVFTAGTVRSHDKPQAHSQTGGVESLLVTRHSQRAFFGPNPKEHQGNSFIHICIYSILLLKQITALLRQWLTLLEL